MITQTEAEMWAARLVLECICSAMEDQLAYASSPGPRRLGPDDAPLVRDEIRTIETWLRRRAVGSVEPDAGPEPVAKGRAKKGAKA